jgi:hypothetical protein
MDCFSDWDMKDRLAALTLPRHRLTPPAPSSVATSYAAVSMQIKSAGGTYPLEITQGSDSRLTAETFGASCGLPRRHIEKLVAAIEEVQRTHFP